MPNGNGKNTHWTFPRTMVRGKFKGRTFHSQKEYTAAQKAWANPTQEGKFQFTCESRSLVMSVSGDLNEPHDVDKLLDLLAAFGSRE